MTEIAETAQFIFGSIGVINCFVLALYFGLFIKPRLKEHIILSMLLLVLSIRVLKTIVYYFYPDSFLIPILLPLGITSSYLIGSLTFLYTAYFLKWKPVPKVYLHLLISFVPSVFLITFFPFEFNKNVWLTYGLSIGFLFWAVYLIKSLWLYRNVKYNASNNRIKKQDFNWIFTLQIMVAIILIAYLLSFYFNSVYIYSSVILGLSIYVLLIVILKSKKGKNSIFGQQILKYNRSKISIDDSVAIKKSIETIIAKPEVFTNNKYRLEHLAKELKIPTAKASQLINETMNSNFNDLMNQKRVTLAKTLILENDIYTLEHIGNKVGFASKSTFYSAFKKFAGMTPNKFRKTHQE
ncbi:helix-turn-helix domain-containing protein [uncultured Croceitalea sp.]|uniref:helix-turn-helix domain-containing protein n=1 Tax=uncultured Croceitalea sp. TaxID=1798908 RepID=UPI003305DAB9